MHRCNNWKIRWSALILCGIKYIFTFFLPPLLVGFLVNWFVKKLRTDCDYKKRRKKKVGTDCDYKKEKMRRKEKNMGHRLVITKKKNRKKNRGQRIVINKGKIKKTRGSGL